MDADLQSLYQRTVLEHCRSPRNFHVIEGADRVAEGFNPLCGDKITVYLRESSSPGMEGILPSGREDTLPPGEEDTLPPGKEDTLPPGREDTLPSGKEDTLPSGREDTLPSLKRESPSPGKEGILPSTEGGTPSPPAFIAELSFQASGCAICLASASMMTELLGGEAADEGRRRSERVLETFHPGAENGLSNLGDIVALGSVRAYPSRIRCVTLPWRTFIAALEGDSGTVSTE